MKKWTYLVAAGMLLGATPVFTGCIDNDEPEGITVLRGAKAELLSAKAAVEAAKVAQVQAEAALTQAGVKVKEAEAIKIQAEAKKIEAEAKIAEAEAAYKNAQTESEKARLQSIIDENKRVQQEWEENAAVRAAEAEAAIKQAEYKTLEAKVKYQQALVSLQSSQQRVLQSYITKLNTATDNYFEALEALRVAQRNVNEQRATVEKNEASKELQTRELTREVSIAESALAGAKEALQLAKDELTEAQGLKPSPLVDKLNGVDDKYNTIRKEIADLSVEAAEKVVAFYAEGRFDEINKIAKEYSTMTDAPQTIAAVEFDFGDGSGYPAYIQRGVYSYPESEYTSNDSWNYYSRIADLQYILGEFKSWTRDENDNAWTRELISKMKDELSHLNTSVINYQQKAWQEAVDAYKTGDYNKTNMDKISGYKEVVEEIAKFNKAAQDLNKALAAQVALERKKVADEKVKKEALDKNKADQTAAKEAAKEAYRTAKDNVKTVFDTKSKNLKDAYDEAVKLTGEKQKALDEALKGTDSDKITAARNALKNAQTAETNANKEWVDYVANGLQKEIDAIELAKTTADAKADADKKTADDKANKDFDALWGATGTDTANLKAADAKVAEETKDMDTATSALKNVSTTYNDNIREHAEAIGATPISLSMIDALAGGAWNKEAGYAVRLTDLDANKLIVLDKDALMYAVLVRSSFLYGGDIWDTNEYGDFEARLEALSDDKIRELINATMTELAETQTITLLDYIEECYSYGSVGKRLALEEQIRIATSWLTNEKVISAKIDQAQQAIDALTKAFEANENAIETKFEELDLAYEKLQADLKATIEPIVKKRAELEPLKGLYYAIVNAIFDYINAGEAMWTETSIQYYINFCKASVETYENEVYEAETDLMEAKDALENWNSDALDELALLQKKLENKQAKVDRMKKELDNAQAALDAMLAKLSAE